MTLRVDDGKQDSGGTTALFGVFDGHGGKEVARFASLHLPSVLSSLEEYRSGDLSNALARSFLKMDELMIQKEYQDELKGLKGSDSDEEREQGETGPSMMINSSQLPESLLEALGMTREESGFVFRIVKSRNESDQETNEGEDNEGAETLNQANESAAMKISKSTQKGEENEAETDIKSDNDTDSFVSASSGEIDLVAGNSAGKRKRYERGLMQIDDNEEDVSLASENSEAAKGGAEIKEIEIEELVRSDEIEAEWHGPSAGCTAVCAAVRDGMLVVANAGDSRCILSRGGTAIALTEDHKPNDPDEYARISKAGGFVADGRVNGSLNLSRALGDLEYKQAKDLPAERQMVTAAPDIRQEKLHEEDEFFILACDGIWDVLTNQEAVDFVRERLFVGDSPKEICEAMCDHCLAPDTNGCGKGCDNMSVIVVLLKNSDVARKAEAARLQR